MNVMQINKFHFVNGGADKYYFDLSQLLAQRGHEVVHFAMNHPQSEDSQYTEFFVPYVDFRSASKNPLGHLSGVSRAVWSRTAQRQLNKLLVQHKPDLAHVHNIYHQLSPSILKTLREYNIPVVMTVHDWNLISCNYVRFHHNAICSHALNGGYWRSVRHKCVNDSYVSSSLKSATQYVHSLMRVYSRYIDCFIFPSVSLAAGHRDSGFVMKEHTVIPNAIDLTQYQPRFHGDDYIIAVGRLSGEKGIDILIDAYMHARHLLGGYSPRLVIVGDGKEREYLRQRADDLHLNGEVVFVGRKKHDDVMRLIRDSRFMVFPSRALENMPLVVLEAMALGKPVIASRIGGVPELVQHGVNGYLFEAGDTQSLAERIADLTLSSSRIEAYGRAGRQFAEQRYSQDRHYQRIMEVYGRVLFNN